jgi:hypothetical protein
MKTKLVIKSLTDIPAEVISAKAASATDGRRDAPADNAASGTPGTVLFVRASPGPLPPEPRAGRDARIFDPQPWRRGGLNE